MLLKCQDEVLSHEDTDLFGIDRFLVFSRSGHNEEVIFVRLDLGSLVYVDHVFQGERVDTEDLAELLDG